MTHPLYAVFLSTLSRRRRGLLGYRGMPQDLESFRGLVSFFVINVIGQDWS